MAAADPALLPSDDDLLFEEDVLRSPYSVKAWTRYLDARRTVPLPRRRVLYERALAALPGSYKVSMGERHREKAYEVGVDGGLD